MVTGWTENVNEMITKFPYIVFARGLWKGINPVSIGADLLIPSFYWKYEHHRNKGIVRYRNIGVDSLIVLLSLYTLIWFSFHADTMIKL
jgi:hypothetical protein